MFTILKDITRHAAKEVKPPSLPLCPRKLEGRPPRKRLVARPDRRILQAGWEQLTKHERVAAAAVIAADRRDPRDAPFVAICAPKALNTIESPQPVLTREQPAARERKRPVRRRQPSSAGVDRSWG